MRLVSYLQTDDRKHDKYATDKAKIWRKNNSTVILVTDLKVTNYDFMSFRP